MLVIIALSNGDPEENVEMMFYIVDLNNDGVITAEVICPIFYTRFNIFCCLRNTKLLPKTYFCLQMKRKYLQRTTRIILQSLLSMKWMLTWMAKLIWRNSEELVTDTTTSFSIIWRTLSQPTDKWCPPKLFYFNLKADYQFNRH